MSPRQVEGAWRLGWTLDVHTTSSVFLGHDQNGREKYETTRSALGELLYQLKYNNQLSAATEIAATMVGFFTDQPVVLSRIDLVVPMPASIQRTVQPVNAIASKVAASLHKPYSENAIRKTKETPTLKNITDLEQRREALDGAFEGDKKQLHGKSVLLIDDVYRSGSTANAVTLAIIAAGATRVDFLATTRTKSNT